jgi:hypothetical protein
MKKIIFLIMISCFVLNCKAQILPVEDVYDYLEAGEGVPEGITYIKDVNNLFDEFIGVWELNYDDKIFELYITEYLDIRNDGNRQEDMLLIRYRITDNFGNIIIDTTLLPDDDLKNMQGRYFLEGGDVYLATFFGPNFNCGEYADVIMYIDDNSLGGNQMVFHLRPNPRGIDPNECTGSWEWSFPKTTYLIFTKQ